MLVTKHQRLGTDDGYQLEDRREPAIELDKEKAISVAKLNAAVHLASKDDEVIPECCILGLEPALRLKERCQQLQSKEHWPNHQREAILSMVQYGWGFQYTQVFAERGDAPPGPGGRGIVGGSVAVGVQSRGVSYMSGRSTQA